MEKLNPDKLVLLDRDGVINEDSDSYIKSPEEWRPIPGSLEAITKLNKRGIDVVVITNQSGIGRGYFNEDTLEQMHGKMSGLIEGLGGSVKDIFFCPHTPDDNCDCRKPKTGMLDQLERKYGISLNSVSKAVPYIGDTKKDLELAVSKNCLPVLVKTGKGQDFYQTEFNSHPVKDKSLVFDTLESATTYLLEKHFS